jgi:hypothetical protein
LASVQETGGVLAPLSVKVEKLICVLVGSRPIAAHLITSAMEGLPVHVSATGPMFTEQVLPLLVQLMPCTLAYRTPAFTEYANV